MATLYSYPPQLMIVPGETSPPLSLALEAWKATPGPDGGFAKTEPAALVEYSSSTPLPALATDPKTGWTPPFKSDVQRIALWEASGAKRFVGVATCWELGTTLESATDLLARAQETLDRAEQAARSTPPSAWVHYKREKSNLPAYWCDTAQTAEAVRALNQSTAGQYVLLSVDGSKIELVTQQQGA